MPGGAIMQNSTDRTYNLLYQLGAWNTTRAGRSGNFIEGSAVSERSDLDEDLFTVTDFEAMRSGSVPIFDQFD